ncbi:MAG: peptidylprolyl isomerase, partial [Duncaniella sp.]|nr:peptidylprolyl isomerase [Duncaniella sp.]
PMMTADGFRITGKVLEVGPDQVVMDFNHPLVGKDLRFKGKVITVRDATAEELHPTSCGGGCCGGGCGDSGCGSGDSSCGCDGCGK